MIFKRRTETPTPSVLTLDNPAGWTTGESVGVSTDAALKLSAVYGAVDYLCNFVASLPIYIYNDTTRRREKDHHLRQLLRLRPNSYQTPADYKRFMMRNLALRGNAYAFIRRNPKTMLPEELIPLRADHVAEQMTEGKLEYVYTGSADGKMYVLDALDVIHYKWDSDNGYTGIPVLRYAAPTLSVAQAGLEYENAIYRNGSRPSGVLQTTADLSGESKTPDPSEEGKFLSKKDVIRQAWERVQAGTGNAFRVAVLDHGLEYKPLTINSYDAQYIAARDFTVSDIARFFGVPLHALMSGKQSYSSNEQNSLEFLQGRGTALLRMMEEEDTYKLLVLDEIERGLWIKRNLDARMRGDSAARATYYRAMHDIGVYNVNDIRGLEDLPDVEGGDIHKASLNYIPLEDFRALSLARNQNVSNLDTEEE